MVGSGRQRGQGRDPRGLGIAEEAELLGQFFRVPLEEGAGDPDPWL